MRIHAVIVAADYGLLMEQDIPRAVPKIHAKPVLLYKLDGFKRRPGIDEIVLVSFEGWWNMVDVYIHQFNTGRLVCVVPGVVSGYGSIRNGVFALKSVAETDDFVVIHDAIINLLATTTALRRGYVSCKKGQCCHVAAVQRVKFGRVGERSQGYLPVHPTRDSQAFVNPTGLSFRQA